MVRGRFFVAQLALVGALGLLLAACQGPGARLGAAPVPPATITITTGNLTFSSRAGAAVRGGGAVVTRSALGALVDKRPDLGIEVSVTGGRLVRVSAVNGAGRAVPGTLAVGAGNWHADWALTPDQSYHVTAAAWRAASPPLRKSASRGCR